MVKYDSSILFMRQDKLSFLIKNDDSITGYLKIIVDPNEIELLNLNPRLIIKWRHKSKYWHFLYGS